MAARVPLASPTPLTPSQDVVVTQEEVDAEFQDSAVATIGLDDDMSARWAAEEANAHRRAVEKKVAALEKAQQAVMDEAWFFDAVADAERKNRERTAAEAEAPDEEDDGRKLWDGSQGPDVEILCSWCSLPILGNDKAYDAAYKGSPLGIGPLHRLCVTDKYAAYNVEVTGQEPQTQCTICACMQRF